MPPSPWWALAPDSLRSPPMANDGSSRQCCSATVSTDVVDVLPCVPAMQATRWPSISPASACARRSTGIPAARAAASSGLVSLIAVETTTADGGSAKADRFSALWPTNSSAPWARSDSSARDSLASEPDTKAPRASRIRAMPDMPAPPIPIRWARRRVSGSSDTGHLQDDLGEYFVGLAVPHADRRRAHLRDAVGVGHQRDDEVGDLRRGEVGVFDHQRGPGVDGGPGVAGLLAVAVGQRDE